jgi:ATP adenylyltransferase
VSASTARSRATWRWRSVSDRVYKPFCGADLASSRQVLNPMSEPRCPFCEPDAARTFHNDDLVVGLWDAFPVSPGHALLAPHRHVTSWFDATADEQIALIRGIAAAREAIEESQRPDGYNIGVNVGRAAGQTVMHLHIHVIPRFAEDVDEPAGGVRFVIPARGNYRNPGFIPKTR